VRNRRQASGLLSWRQDWCLLIWWALRAPAVCDWHARQSGHGIGALEARLDDDCGFALRDGPARDFERLRMNRVRSMLRLGLRGCGSYGSIAGILLLWSDGLLWPSALLRRLLRRLLRWAGGPFTAWERVVPACLSFALEPPLLVFVLVVFMGKVAPGDDLQAAEDHGYDVTWLRYEAAIW
jgi:hypothetical protein